MPRSDEPHDLDALVADGVAGATALGTKRFHGRPFDCEPECPAEAILPDTESGLEQWLELNTKYSAEWPNITTKKDSPEDADEFKGVEGKFETYFSAEPGDGD